MNILFYKTENNITININNNTNTEEKNSWKNTNFLFIVLFVLKS